MKNFLKSKKGFTLVEVIVVAVIVGVLAIGAILLYQGYVAQSQTNAANNLAASAASYLQSISNAISRDTAVAKGTVGLNAGQTWSSNLPNGQAVTFTCPQGATITGGNPNITATISGRTSNPYNY
ncbi:MAG: prepilin-type N-terminal cleavage/methylation domain-containing protein [Chitinivibrionales bacterium]|nr:prepilin-type N-terminal cleavage/methylation domain-containing protein [Chitinivibrionales bacterium]